MEFKRVVKAAVWQAGDLEFTAFLTR